MAGPDIEELGVGDGRVQRWVVVWRGGRGATSAAGWQVGGGWGRRRWFAGRRRGRQKENQLPAL
jgi:hypothetical protein